MFDREERPMPMTLMAPVAAPARPNQWRADWIPPSELPWLEALRAEHERLVADWLQMAGAQKALAENLTTLRAEYVQAVALAAREDAQPPAMPAKLLPDYEAEALRRASDVEAAARTALQACINRVGSAVGAHRLSQEWLAATSVEEGAPQDSPAMRLRVFEGCWTWPTPPVPRVTSAELQVEIDEATAELQRLTADANRELEGYRERVRDAEEHGVERPPPPDLDDTMMLRSNAVTRLERAFADRDAPGVRRAA